MTVFAKIENLPTITIEGDGDWEVQFSGSGLPDGAELAMTKYGLFVQVGGKFISLDVADLLDLCENDGQGVDESLFVNVAGGPSLVDLIEHLGAGVKVALGPAPVVVTGKERALAEWSVVSRPVEYLARPERLIVANGAERTAVL